MMRLSSLNVRKKKKTVKKKMRFEYLTKKINKRIGWFFFIVFTQSHS